MFDRKKVAAVSPQLTKTKVPEPIADNDSNREKWIDITGLVRNVKWALFAIMIWTGGMTGYYIHKVDNISSAMFNVNNPEHPDYQTSARIQEAVTFTKASLDYSYTMGMLKIDGIPENITESQKEDIKKIQEEGLRGPKIALDHLDLHQSKTERLRENLYIEKKGNFESSKQTRNKWWVGSLLAGFWVLWLNLLSRWGKKTPQILSKNSVHGREEDIVLSLEEERKERSWTQDDSLIIKSKVDVIPLRRDVPKKDDKIVIPEVAQAATKPLTSQPEIYEQEAERKGHPNISAVLLKRKPVEENTPSNKTLKDNVDVNDKARLENHAAKLERIFILLWKRSEEAESMRPRFIKNIRNEIKNIEARSSSLSWIEKELFLFKCYLIYWMKLNPNEKNWNTEINIMDTLIQKLNNKLESNPNLITELNANTQESFAA